MIKFIKDKWNAYQVKRFIRQRDEAFLSTDYSWARKQLPPLTTEFRVMKTFHLARMLWTECPIHLKYESICWLTENKDKEE